MNEFIAYVDGGFRKHIDIGAYGSFVVYFEDKEVNRATFRLDSLTSNQAEYDSLLFLIDFLRYIFMSKKEVSVTIYSDSELMINQINGKDRCYNKPLKAKLKRIRKFIKDKNITFIWVKRDKIVEILGH